MRPDFITVADKVAAEIALGRLRPGDRLLPQRAFAHRHDMAVSTASRVYAELARRGLVAGEVGRGTYVRALPAPAYPPLVEPAAAPVDLELIFPLLPEHGGILAHALAQLAGSPTFFQALRPIGAAATQPAREAAAAFLARPGWVPDPACVLFGGNGRQAIAAALAALARPGDRVGVETMSYPVVKGIAARLGLILVPVEMDGEGMVPEALASVHRTTPLAAVYVQPSLHSPLGTTMGEGRRAALARLLSDAGLIAIEDGVYSFLADGDTPLAALAPGCAIFVDSLSKRVAPGLTLGLLVAPEPLVGRLAAALRSGAWSASGLPLAAGVQWMSDGSAQVIAERKRADARTRQAVAREMLGGLGLSGDPRAYHAWLPLPEPWRADVFAAAALRRGIAVTPGSAFTVGVGQAPAGIRLALASPDLPALAAALDMLRRLATGEIEAGQAE